MRATTETHMLIIDPHPALGRHAAPFTRYGCFNLQVKKLLRLRAAALYSGWLSLRDSVGVAGSCASGRVIWWCWKDSSSADCFDFRPYSRVSLGGDLCLFGRDCGSRFDHDRNAVTRRPFVPGG